MNKNLTKEASLKICKIGAVILTSLAAIFGALSFVTCMTESGRYFRTSFAVTMLHITIAATVLLAISSIFLFTKSQKIESERKWIKYIYALPAIGLLPLITIFFKSLNTLNFAVDTERLKCIISILIFATAILSLGYFIAVSFNFKGGAVAGFGYVFILFCMLAIAQIHTDHSFEMNSPFKITIQFTAVATALNALSDIRNHIGRPSASQYVSAKLCCLVLNVLCLISSAVAYSQGYGINYLTYSVFFTSCAICSSIEFFTSTVSELPEAIEEIDDINGSTASSEDGEDPAKESAE